MIIAKFLMLAMVLSLVVYAGGASAGKNLTFFKDVAKQAGCDDKGHGKGFFEIKFKGPDGTVFDIAGHPWMGAKGLEG